MITIIFAPPRTGKTCLMTHLANLAAFDRQRTKAMQEELFLKSFNGFDAIETLPPHCVAANYDITLRKFLHRPMHSRRINPYRLGFANEFVKTHFSIPYEFYCITEAQKYLNSRMFQFYPDWQSRFYEQHGHNYLDFLLDTQRPELIDANIRSLSSFIEVLDLDIQTDIFNKPHRLEWTVRKIPNCSLYERYMSSGKKDRSCYEEEIITADYNVFASYDSRLCKPKFYQGHLDEDIDYNRSEPTEQTLKGYIQYLESADDEQPKNFYIKRSAA